MSQRTVVLVNDGLATGATMLAAARTLRTKLPKQIIVAIPVAAPQSCEEFQALVDRVIAPRQPSRFTLLGSGMRTSRKHATPRSGTYSNAPPASTSREESSMPPSNSLSFVL